LLQRGEAHATTARRQPEPKLNPARATVKLRLAVASNPPWNDRGVLALYRFVGLADSLPDETDWCRSIGGDDANSSWRIHMKKLSMLAAAGAFALMLAPSAQAMSPAPVGSSTDVIQVAGGCGPGFHRGPGGRCLRNRAEVCHWRLTPRGRVRVCR
jgi:hypothetical protein